MAIFCSGMFVGFFKGWKLSLLFLVSGVVLIPAVGILGYMLERGFS